MTLTPALIDELFRHAGRSPSAHNTQPWIPRFVAGDGHSPAEVVLTVDPLRTLPAGDPTFEDLHLSMGCWVESFAIAADEAGLSVETTSIRGCGSALEVRIQIGEGTPSSTASTVAADNGASDPWPPFGVADLYHRQVDRGPLRRDGAAFASALRAVNSALSATGEPLHATGAGSGAELVEIPDQLWKPLQGRSSLYSLSDPAIFRETLDWLRFDSRDPRCFRDGLSANCLRIPPMIAAAAARLNTASLRPWIGSLTSAVLTPVGFAQRIRASLRRRALSEDFGSGEGQPPRTTVPHHVILTVDDALTATAGGWSEDHDRSTRDDIVQAHVRAAQEVEVGRTLLRIWLLFDRCGLRVDVHSELKDCPETKAELSAFLARRSLVESATTELPSPQNSPRSRRRPIAAFSVGRSTSEVPRSHRLNT